MISKDVLDEHEILEKISQSVIVVDPDGTVIYWNNASKKVFGYSKEEMINQPISKIYPSFAKDKLEFDLERLKNGKNIDAQWKSITKDGSIVWIDLHTKPLKNADGDIMAIIASSYDIQHLKEIESELEENKARAQAILETTVDGIVTADENGQILSFNQAASKIFGYDEEEVIGKSVHILMPEPHRSNHDDYVRRYIETGENHIIGLRREMTGIRKDGTIFPLELSVSEVKWNTSRIFTGVINDITDRRRLEQEILRVSEEERRSIGQDLHDGLGQMLTGIGLISQNLARKLKSNGIPGADEVQEVSDLIKEADEYAKALAHGLIHVDVEEGLNVALKSLSAQARKFFRVNCNFTNNSDIKIYNSMTVLNLYRIAQEAVSNAVKHGKAENIKIILSSAKDIIKLEIIDDGIGFSNSKDNEQAKGMGVRIMGYRSNMMSGQFSIEEIDNQTHVICEIPSDNI